MHACKTEFILMQLCNNPCINEKKHLQHHSYISEPIQTDMLCCTFWILWHEIF